MTNDSVGSDSEFRRRRARLLLWLVLVNVLVAVLASSLAFIGLQSSRHMLTQQARTAAEILADTLQRGVASEIALFDMALRGATLQLRSRPGLDRAQTERLLAAQWALVPELTDWYLTDARGAVRAGVGLFAQAQADMAEAEMFQRARADRSSHLLISEPQLDSDGKRWAVHLARRVEGPDGFVGVLGARLAVDHFQRQLTTVGVAVTLRSSSLKVIARHWSGHSGPVPVGVSKTSDELHRELSLRPTRGSYMARTAIDGVDRINAYHRVEGYPLIALVGFDTESYFAPWRTQRFVALVLVALVWLVLAAASWLVFAAWQRQAAAARMLFIQGRRHGALLRTASDGIHVLDRDAHLVECSDTFADMLGCTREELAGRHAASWDVQLPLRDAAQWLQDRAGSSQRKFETMHRRFDGRLIDVEVHCTLVRIDGEEFIYCSSRDITERKRVQQHVEHLAFHDALTGLPNRLLFTDRAHQAIAHAERHGLRLAFCYLDLDGFKQVNDRQGHDAGDQLLKEVAARLAGCLRSNDTVSRCGGDEFLVLLTGLGEACEEEVLLERLRYEVSRPVRLGNGLDVRISASLGVASYPLDGRGLDQILARADEAMYLAKKQGRNRIVHYGRAYGPEHQACDEAPA